ncbi:DUF2079 domain-containing protein [Kitasatospora sp. NPDC057223]|uniref:DUF2079 domain-containing protein n=1 Tax=Kitasatospora sp. NPDC057223 TaxID=3346055 RepID=UPI00363C636B
MLLRRLSRALPILLAVLLFAAYGAVAVLRHLRLETAGFDLGIFEQGVRGYAGFEAPVAPLKGAGFDLRGDHFSPVLIMLAPLYRVFPSALTLLLAQAALFAVSVMPVARFAVEVADRRLGALLGLAYGLSWGLWAAVEFDFHEVAFAVPVTALAVTALARDRTAAAVRWALLLLLVKEDQGLLVASVGGYLAVRGRRLPGAVLIGAATVATAVAVLLAVPAYSPYGLYTYATEGSWNGGAPLARLLLPGVKGLTVLALLAPTLFVALRSPLCLLAVLPLVARFWSVNPAYWGTTEHYNATLVPVFFVAMLDGVRRSRRGVRAAVVLALPVAVAMFPMPSLQLPGAQDRAVRSTLSAVPDGASVAASNRLAPQLTGRCTVSLFPFLSPPDRPGPWSRPVAGWVVAFDRPDDFPLPAAQQRDALAELPAAGYRVVASGGGVTVYRWGAG